MPHRVRYRTLDGRTASLDPGRVETWESRNAPGLAAALDPADCLCWDGRGAWVRYFRADIDPGQRTAWRGIQVGPARARAWFTSCGYDRLPERALELLEGGPGPDAAGHPRAARRRAG